MTASVSPREESTTIGLPNNDIGKDRIGIVDIGSNTVRLVVYDAPARLPVPIFNERVACGLGIGMGSTGRLNPEGVELARQCLARFCGLAKEMQVDQFKMLATAAVRDAEDGEEFARNIEDTCGFPVQILSGEEEARLGAAGIIGGSPSADGLFGDMGGGSLDLVSLDHGKFGHSVTLPLGHLRITEDAEGNPKKAQRIIDTHLDQVPWLGDISGRSFYAVGGTWRALARVYIEQVDYPLHMIDNFTVGVKEARDLTRVISRLSPNSLEQMSGVARRRSDTLPLASLVLNRLLKRTKPTELIFSGYGLREGQFFDLLPDDLKRQDPLIAACEGFAQRGGRFSAHGDEISDWIAPLFRNVSESDFRLIKAAALLSDIGWTEHPDYRALHAFIRILRLPIAGVTHRERVLLALSIFVRYNGKRRQFEVRQVRALLEEDDDHLAAVLGHALRLAHTVSGGVPGLLPRTKLSLDAGEIRLNLGSDRQLFFGEAVERLMDGLAKFLKVRPVIS